MCTALYFPVGGGFLGRTLDLEHGYWEQVTVTPSGYLGNRYAMVGMAANHQGYPLYFDGVNEVGLAVAGLNFPHSARYEPDTHDTVTIAPYELIPTLLGRCGSVAQAVSLLRGLRLCHRAPAENYSVATLHWMLTDGAQCVVVESTETGLYILDNPAGVLTNEPPLPHQLSLLKNYAHLSADAPQEGWQQPQSRGAGSVGLPGDFSSPGRFVRGAFALANAHPTDQPMGQVFHLLDTVAVPKGCVRLADGRQVITRYSACMDLRRRTYFYRTYGCHRVHAVALGRQSIATDTLTTFPLPEQEDVKWEN